MFSLFIGCDEQRITWRACSRIRVTRCVGLAIVTPHLFGRSAWQHVDRERTLLNRNIITRLPVS
jgi:hypothetical protein